MASVAGAAAGIGALCVVAVITEAGVCAMAFLFAIATVNTAKSTVRR